jgi:hypothetical protein
MEVLDKYGPVAVAIDSSHPSFVSYGNYAYGESGTCSNKKLGLIPTHTNKFIFILFIINIYF